MHDILIVDDEAIARRMLGMTLGRAGFSVREACNGEQALELIGQAAPDAMITDIDMPRLNGEQLCARLEADMPHREFPIIVVTSKTAIEHRAWSRQMANLSFVEKPFSMRRLVERLKTLLKDEAGAMDRAV